MGVISPQARSALVPVIYWSFKLYQCLHFVTIAAATGDIVYFMFKMSNYIVLSFLALQYEAKL